MDSPLKRTLKHVEEGLKALDEHQSRIDAVIADQASDWETLRGLVAMRNELTITLLVDVRALATLLRPRSIADGMTAEQRYTLAPQTCPRCTKQSPSGVYGDGCPRCLEGR